MESIKKSLVNNWLSLYRVKNKSQIGVEMRRAISKAENRGLGESSCIGAVEKQGILNIKFQFGFFSYKKIQIWSTWAWYSCTMFLPQTLVHNCFPDGKKSEGERAGTRSVGTIYQQRKILAQTSFVPPDFLLRFLPHSLDLHHTTTDCWPLWPQWPYRQAPLHLGICQMGRWQVPAGDWETGIPIFLTLLGGPLAGSGESCLQRPQLTSGGSLLRLQLSRRCMANTIPSCLWLLSLGSLNPL